MNAVNRSHFVYVTFIRTTPAKLWEALTDPQFIRQYWFNTTIEFITAVSGGWPRILSNLKSLLETGKIAITSHSRH